MKILVILGSVRENGNGIKVLDYLTKKLPSYKTNKEFDFVNLKDIPLTHYKEPSSPRSNSNYTYPETINWSNLVKKYDGYIFVTPEYNGFFTGALKDAIDLLYHEWEGKKVGVIGYGSRGAKRAVKMLKILLESFKMDIIDDVIGVHKVWNIDPNNFDESLIEGNLEEFVSKM